MQRYYVEIHCVTGPDDRLDNDVDVLMEALVEEPGLIDADVLAELATGQVTISASVDGEDEAVALRDALTGIRSAAHKAGARTPDWAAVIAERTETSVRPAAAATC